MMDVNRKEKKSNESYYIIPDTRSCVPDTRVNANGRKSRYYNFVL